MKPVRVEHDDIKKAIQSGNPYIQVGSRKFLLCEVEEVYNKAVYEVLDHDEEKKLLDALNKQNPILSEDEINKLLRK